MTPENKTSVESYDRAAEKLSGIYNNLSSGTVLPWLEEKLPVSTPEKKLSALDLGCGSGRDAFWLAAEKGFSVVAMDASVEMIRQAEEKKKHSDVAYLVDELPAMEKVKALGRKFDVILMSAVWMHLNAQERSEMVDNIAALSNAAALVYISLRDGPSPADRPMFPVSVEEVRTLARSRGMGTEYLGDAEDKQGRGDVVWRYVALTPSKPAPG